LTLVHRCWRVIPAPVSHPTGGRHTKALGRMLFTQYLLPFEIVSVLLLVAMVGVILLSKRISSEMTHLI
jgi:NADH:ubiquinone oxidoreductase subunit 6 (subunit J)